MVQKVGFDLVVTNGTIHFSNITAFLEPPLANDARHACKIVKPTTCQNLSRPNSKTLSEKENEKLSQNGKLSNKGNLSEWKWNFPRSGKLSQTGKLSKQGKLSE